MKNYLMKGGVKMQKMSRKCRSLIIIGAATAIVVFFDVVAQKIQTKEIKVSDKYVRIAFDASVFAKECSKRVLLSEIDDIFDIK